MKAEKVENDDHIEDIDYHITLSGCGQMTGYHFPNIKVCPNRSCSKKFKDRLQTMNHFREQHADSSIFCYICQKPICSQARMYFIRHYNRMHPNMKVPYDFDNSEKSPLKRVCSIRSDNTIDSKDLVCFSDA